MPASRSGRRAVGARKNVALKLREVHRDGQTCGVRRRELCGGNVTCALESSVGKVNGVCALLASRELNDKPLVRLHSEAVGGATDQVFVQDSKQVGTDDADLLLQRLIQAQESKTRGVRALLHRLPLLAR